MYSAPEAGRHETGEVDRLLAAGHDRARLQLAMGHRIQVNLSRTQALGADLRELRAALTGPAAGQEDVLRRLQARDGRRAYALGDWFSLSTGFRAPGEPIGAEGR